MKKIKIPKKTKGQYREIYLPDKCTKRQLAEVGRRVDAKITQLEKNGSIRKSVIHGFHMGRSPVTNAKEHIGYQYTLSMDLRDFFDSVRPHHVGKMLPANFIEAAFVDNAPRQGLPSSPAICNMAASKMDTAILRFLDKNKLSVKYTRYADDLSFSFDEKSVYDVLKKQIQNIVSKCGFELNKKKTRLQSASFGRREITGIMVDDKDVYPSRKFKRRMRATKHAGNEESFRGMQEWAKCKVPSTTKNKQKKIFNVLRKSSKIRKAKITVRPLKEIRKDNMLITNDLCYILGMTDLARGWSSCYKSTGCNRNAPVFLAQFNISVGLILSDEQIKYRGLIRNRLLARCIIYHRDDGKSVARSFYGKTTDAFYSFLKENGILLKAQATDEPCRVEGKGLLYPKSVMYNGAYKVQAKESGFAHLKI